MSRKVFLGIVTGVTLSLAACGGGDSGSQSTVTETVSSSTYEADSEPVDDTSMSSDEIGDAALQITWDNMTAAEQEQICSGWNLYPTVSLDSFMDAAGEGTFTRSQVKAFFDGEC